MNILYCYIFIGSTGTFECGKSWTYRISSNAIYWIWQWVKYERRCFTWRINARSSGRTTSFLRKFCWYCSSQIQSGYSNILSLHLPFLKCTLFNTLGFFLIFIKYAFAHNVRIIGILMHIIIIYHWYIPYYPYKKWSLIDKLVTYFIILFFLRICYI